MIIAYDGHENGRRCQEKIEKVELVFLLSFFLFLGLGSQAPELIDSRFAPESKAFQFSPSFFLAPDRVVERVDIVMGDYKDLLVPADQIPFAWG